MKRTMILILATALPLCAGAQRDSLVTVFWNLENFFDTKGGGVSDSEMEFSSSGVRHWTWRRFSTKRDAVAKMLLRIGDRYGRMPDVVGFAEIENRYVVESLVKDTPLRKLGYGIVHFDSPDHRGIDCALIYRLDRLTLDGAVPKHLYDSDGAVMHTRDILLARFDSLAVLVNHHPSKVGAGSSGRRNAALERLGYLCDSLELTGCGRIVAMGDFNEDLWHTTEGKGTIKYQGRWEKIDGCFVRGVDFVEDVFEDVLLLEKDAAYGGMKPRRTYSGPRYHGGISDHLPIVVMVYF